MSPRGGLFFLGALLWVGLQLDAQRIDLAGPMPGFVFEEWSRSVRPLIGVPGSWRLGQPVVSNLEWASVAPDGRATLAADGGRVYVTADPRRPRLEWQRLEAAVAAPVAAVWTADSSAVVLYSPAAAELLVVRGPWASPAVAPPIDAAPLGGPILWLILDREAERVLAGVAGGVYLLGQGDAPRRLARLPRPVAAALANDGSDLLLAEAGSRQILEIRRFASTAEPRVLAISPAMPWEPVGIAASEDGQRIFVVDRASASVEIYGVSCGCVLDRLALDFPPAHVQPLSPARLFLLSRGRPGREPLQILHAAVAPAVYFVPALMEE